MLLPNNSVTPGNPQPIVQDGSELHLGVRLGTDGEVIQARCCDPEVPQGAAGDMPDPGSPSGNKNGDTLPQFP